MYLKLHCVSVHATHLIPVCCATTECDSLESASITCNENKDNVSEPTPKGLHFSYTTHEGGIPKHYTAARTRRRRIRRNRLK